MPSLAYHLDQYRYAAALTLAVLYPIRSPTQNRVLLCCLVLYGQSTETVCNFLHQPLLHAGIVLTWLPCPVNLQGLSCSATQLACPCALVCAL